MKKGSYEKNAEWLEISGSAFFLVKRLYKRTWEGMYVNKVTRWTRVFQNGGPQDQMDFFSENTDFSGFWVLVR